MPLTFPVAAQGLPAERASTHQPGNRGAQDSFHFHGCPTGAGPGSGADPGPGAEGAHLSCAGHGRSAGARAARKRKECIWNAAGTNARPEGDEGADWDKGPKQEGEQAQQAGKGARDL